MAGLGELLSWLTDLGNPATLQLYSQLWGGAENQRAYEESKAENEGRYNEGVDIQNQRYGRVMGDAQGLADAELGIRGQTYGRALDQATQLGSAVTEGYGQRRDDVLGYLDPRISDIESGYGQRATDIPAYYDTVTGAVNQEYRDLGAGLESDYQEREDRGLGYLEGQGVQGRQDIGTRYGNLAAQAQADLTARGLGGSTVSSGIAAAHEREKSADLNRFGEQINRQFLDTYAGLSGDRLRARERVTGERLSAQERSGALSAGMRADLSGQNLSAMERLTAARAGAQADLSRDYLTAMETGGQRLLGLDVGLSTDMANATRDVGRYGIGLDTGLTGEMLNWIQSRTDTYPTSNIGTQLSGMFGSWAEQQRAARAAAEQQSNAMWGNIIGAGGRVGAAAITGGAGGFLPSWLTSIPG